MSQLNAQSEQSEPMNGAQIKIAMATFVKTPGMSPIKTRLAASVGAQRALEFYIESVGQTYGMIEKLREIFSTVNLSKENFLQPNITGEFKPYWAVAEKSALGAIFWQKWPQIWQGDGNLGDRLSSVYSQLREQHDIVAFYGADSPHIAGERLFAALQKVISRAHTTVVGPTEDGGFYFLASSLKITPSVFKSVTYSSAGTLSELKNSWPEKMFEIEKDFDVDTAEDLNRLEALHSARQVMITSER